MSYSIFNVIKYDYCIGCGACAYADRNFTIGFDKLGMYKAQYNNNIEPENVEIADKYCPFSDNTIDEDQLSEIYFEKDLLKNENIGKYIECFAGYVKEKPFRKTGSSGGFGKWILYKLIKERKVDYIIQVTEGGGNNELFSYKVFRTDDAVLKGSKSAYYPVTIANMLNFIRENKGYYAITALPCFSKALRNICLQDNVISKRLKYIIGIVCGHLKSSAFAELFAWQLGVFPDNLKSIEFRDKIKGMRANEKGAYAINKKDEKTPVKSSKTLFGGNWGHGLFKYKACDYCDDVLGETADLSVGDAWLDDYINDPAGNNVLVIRNKEIHKLVIEGIKRGDLKFEPIDVQQLVKSQEGGLRNRREGLQYRVYKQKRKGKWVPKKRNFHFFKIKHERKRIYRLREIIRVKSHKYFHVAKEKNDLYYFINKMQKITKKTEKPGLLYRIESKLYRKWQPIKKVLNLTK